MIERLLEKLKSNDYADSWKQYQYGYLAAVISQQIGSRSVVDVGCAEGLLTSYVKAAATPGSSVIGMDLSPHPLWPTAQSGALFIAGDASRPPLKSKATEVVIAKDLLHHAEDPPAALTWLVRLATQRVIIVEANAANPIMAMYTRHNGDQHFDRARLQELLATVVPEAAVKMDEAIAYPFYLPPVRSLSALWVWPLTGLMVLLFKVLRLRWPAKVLQRVAQRMRWPSPFMIRTFDVSDCY